VDSLEVRGGTITHPSASKYVFFGDPATPANVRVRLFDVAVSGGGLARYVSGSEFSGVTMTGASSAAFSTVDNSSVRDCVLACDFVGYACNRLRLERVKATVTSADFNSGDDNHTVDRYTKGSTYVHTGALRRGHEAALYLGGYSLWVDASGKLRILGSVPTSDTDGVVVGTQT
jgi:hypothetical protein